MRNLIDIVEAAELPMDDASRMARAKELGFTIPAFHGTGAKFNEFDLEKGKPSIMGGYAPMFADTKKEADGYAKERKAEGLKAHVLHVLLRVKNPLEINMNGGNITTAMYKKIVGDAFKPSGYVTQPTGYQALRDLGYKIGWSDHRAHWTQIYAKLKKLGFDALMYTDVPADHHNGRYTKYVVLDPKNIRSIKAAFDPAHSESADIRS